MTVGIGLVPNYSTIGIWAPISLLFLRVVQGIAAGGEMSGSAIFGLESAPDNKRALYGSFTSMGSGIGALTGVIIFFTISEVFGERAFQEWAWRIPFLFGAVILVFVFLARRGVVEQEKIEFEKKEQQSEIASFPLGEVFRNYKLTFLKVVGVEIGYMAFAMLGAIYFLTYLKSVGFSDHVTMFAQILYQVVIVPLVPVMAMISDNWNRKALMCIGSILNICTMTAFFMIVPGSAPMVVYILTIAVAVTTTVMYGGMLTFLAEQFPARIRYTGFGVAFAVGGAIGGGFGPTVAAIIFGASNRSGIMLSLFAAGLGLLMVISTLGLKNHSQCMLEEIDTDLVHSTEAIQKYVESGK